MEGSIETRKNCLFRKTWERCKSLRCGQSLGTLPSSSRISLPSLMVKSRSWSSSCSSTLPTAYTQQQNKWIVSKKPRVGFFTPEGCFSVYVGPDKQRFMIKVECTNHPLFRTLLEEAEVEYGFHSDGPLLLPCDVNLFIKVLSEMNGKNYTNSSFGLR